MQTSNPIANPIVVLREEFDDWAVLFNPDTADAVGINPVGVHVWKQMDGQRNVDSIVENIKDQFSEVSDTIHQEVNSFIDQLAENGFVGYEMENAKNDNSNNN